MVGGKWVNKEEKRVLEGGLIERKRRGVSEPFCGVTVKVPFQDERKREEILRVSSFPFCLLFMDPSFSEVLSLQ